MALHEIHPMFGRLRSPELEPGTAELVLGFGVSLLERLSSATATDWDIVAMLEAVFRMSASGTDRREQASVMSVLRAADKALYNVHNRRSPVWSAIHQAVCSARSFEKYQHDWSEIRASSRAWRHDGEFRTPDPLGFGSMTLRISYFVHASPVFALCRPHRLGTERLRPYAYAVWFEIEPDTVDPYPNVVQWFVTRACLQTMNGYAIDRAYSSLGMTPSEERPHLLMHAHDWDAIVGMTSTIDQDVSLV